MAILFLVLILLSLYHLYMENVIIPTEYLELRLKADDLAQEILQIKANVPKPSLLTMFEGLLHITVRLDQKGMMNVFLILFPKFFQHAIKSDPSPTSNNPVINSQIITTEVINVEEKNTPIINSPNLELIYKKILNLLYSGLLLNMRGWYIYLYIIAVILSPFFLILSAFKNFRELFLRTKSKIQSRILSVLITEL